MTEPSKAAEPALVSSNDATSSQAPVTLTKTTARDLEAALADSAKPHPFSRQGSNASAPEPSANDLVARRIVMRRDRWDALLRLTEALEAERGVVATPAEVAAIVLDAGLNVILEEAHEARADEEASRGAATCAGTATTEAPAVRRQDGKGRLERRATVTPGAATRSERRPNATPAPAPAKAVALAPALTAKDQAQLLSLTAGLLSHRSIQRTIALWLGSRASEALSATGVQVPVEDLRALCREHGVYCTDNFAQNMKKDAAFFVEVRDPRTGERIGYALTPAGIVAASALATSTLA